MSILIENCSNKLSNLKREMFPRSFKIDQFIENISEILFVKNLKRNLRIFKLKWNFLLHQSKSSQSRLITTREISLASDLPNDVVLVGAVNNISFKFPTFPPLSQPDDLSESLFCDSQNIPETCRGRQICPCVHRLKVRLNSIVELVVLDETNCEFAVKDETWK